MPLALSWGFKTRSFCYKKTVVKSPVFMTSWRYNTQYNDIQHTNQNAIFRMITLDALFCNVVRCLHWVWQLIPVCWVSLYWVPLRQMLWYRIKDNSYLIQGEKSVTSMTSEQDETWHSENSLVQRSEHPSPPEQTRFRERNPFPHSAEQSDHSDLKAMSFNFFLSSSRT